MAVSGKIDPQVVLSLYDRGWSLHKLARQFRCGAERVRQAIIQAGGRIRSNAPVYQPTAEQIAQATETIRNGWTAEDYCCRAGIRPVPVGCSVVYPKFRANGKTVFGIE